MNHINTEIAELLNKAVQDIPDEEFIVEITAAVPVSYASRGRDGMTFGYTQVTVKTTTALEEKTYVGTVNKGLVCISHSRVLDAQLPQTEPPHCSYCGGYHHEEPCPAIEPGQDYGYDIDTEEKEELSRFGKWLLFVLIFASVAFLTWYMWESWEVWT